MRTSTILLTALWILAVLAAETAQHIILTAEPVLGQEISMRQMTETNQQFVERRAYEGVKPVVLSFLVWAPAIMGVSIVARELKYHLTKKDSK